MDGGLVKLTDPFHYRNYRSYTVSLGMTKSKRTKEERERFAQMPEADLIELRAVLHREISVLVREKDQKVGSIKRIDSELTKRRHPDAHRVIVTDHAIVRYLERMEGLDVEAVRRKVEEMARRAVRRDDEFMDDPQTGMIVVRRKGSDSVATVMNSVPK